jgi:hypothetical protein
MFIAAVYYCSTNCRFNLMCNILNSICLVPGKCNIPSCQSIGWCLTEQTFKFRFQSSLLLLHILLVPLPCLFHFLLLPWQNINFDALVAHNRSKVSIVPYLHFKSCLNTFCTRSWSPKYDPHIRKECICRGSLPLAVNLYRSCVGLGLLALETTGFRLVRASEE